MTSPVVQLTKRGLMRWKTLHPWIFASDCEAGPTTAGVVCVSAPNGKDLGLAFYSPHSQIRLRRLNCASDTPLMEMWRERLTEAIARRRPLEETTNAYRVVFGESDGLPSIIVDRYNTIAVIQTLSAGAETVREPICELAKELLPVQSIVSRNDVPVREREGLPVEKKMVWGTDARTVVREGSFEFEVDTMEGQKTGAFLDHRQSRFRLGALSHGRVLDAFGYEGWCACHLAEHAESVLTVDGSESATQRTRENLLRNKITHVEAQTANVFDLLKDLDQKREMFDVIHLDPPAFVKSRAHLETGIRGYKEINLRAMRCLKPGGILVTSSCSQHMTRDLMLEMLREAASDVGCELFLREELAQDMDHPFLLAFPESAYLKGFILQRV